MKRHITATTKTMKRLSLNLAKHRSDVHLKKEKETTGLTIHAVTKSHTFDFEDVTILEQIPNYWQRLIAEKMYIHKATNTVNTQIDKAGLHASYINLMKLQTSNNTTRKKNKVNTAPTTNSPNSTNVIHLPEGVTTWIIFTSNNPKKSQIIPNNS